MYILGLRILGYGYPTTFGRGRAPKTGGQGRILKYGFGHFNSPLPIPKPHGNLPNVPTSSLGSGHSDGIGGGSWLALPAGHRPVIHSRGGALYASI